MNLDKIREALRAAGLERLADVAERLTRPAIRIEPTMVDEDTIPIGASKLGGRPDLPRDMAWPERDGRPLGFLAQFNLAEVAPYDVEKVLPPSGMLYFFYDFTNERCGVSLDDRTAWQVLYFDGSVGNSQRIYWPTSLPHLYRLPDHLIQFSAFLSLTHEPDWVVGALRNDDERGSYREISVKHDYPPDMRLKETEDDSEEDVAAFEEAVFEYRATRHQLLGHPFLVHYGTMPWTCDALIKERPNPLFSRENAGLDFTPYESWPDTIKSSVASTYKSWRLLFQLGNVSGKHFEGTDENDPLWQMCELWARGGLMYFWIERDRLARRDFSRVWMLGACQF
jgi:uncharacterized protein YwqG